MKIEQINIEIYTRRQVRVQKSRSVDIFLFYSSIFDSVSALPLLLLLLTQQTTKNTFFLLWELLISLRLFCTRECLCHSTSLYCFVSYFFVEEVKHLTIYKKASFQVYTIVQYFACVLHFGVSILNFRYRVQRMRFFFQFHTKHSFNFIFGVNNYFCCFD